MACGLPWVSTDRGALPETVGNAGIHVPAGRVTHAGAPAIVQQLAHSVLRVMREPDEAERMQSAGLARAKTRTWSAVAEEIAEAAQVTATPAKSGYASTHSPGASIRSGDRAPQVMIVTPSYVGRYMGPYVRSVIETTYELRERGITSCWFPLAGNALLPLARNVLAAEFLAAEACTHSLWIDSDISWSASDVLRLLSHKRLRGCDVSKEGRIARLRPRSPAALPDQLDEWIDRG
jgi:hypothetical protein